MAEEEKELTFEEVIERTTGEKLDPPVNEDTPDAPDPETPTDGKPVETEVPLDESDLETPEPQEATEEETELELLRRTVVRQAGHSSSLQVKLNEINNKATVVRQARAPVIDENGVFTDSFKQLKEEFPEADFGRVENIMFGLQEQINELTVSNEQTVNNIQQGREQDYRVSQVNLVTARHPDAEEIRSSPEFATWRNSLPPEEQQSMNTWDASVISVSLDRFKAATGFKSKAISEAESNSLAQQTTDKRERRESASVGVKTKQPAVPVLGGADGFNAKAEKEKVYKRLGVDYS